MSAASVPVDADIEARRPVWLAQSDLNLDTAYRDSLGHAACELARSPYTPRERQVILFDTVHPLPARNRCTTAGACERFDQDGLARSIARHRQRPRGLRARGRCQRRYAGLRWRLLEWRIAGARAATSPPRSRFDFNRGN